MPMHLPSYAERTRGISLVDTVVGIAIVTVVFTGIISGLRFALELISVTRGQEGALSIANNELEFIRSLPYGEVGTVGGIPSGDIPQEETVELNRVSYTKRVFIQYVDAPEDGTGSEDENDIVADYKRVRVAVSWSDRGTSYEEVLVSDIVPPGIETEEGGGTLKINVFDANVAPVEEAEVRVVNASTSPEIDVTTYTNTEGVAIFSGAPAHSGYEITATKAGYSTAKTYGVTAENPDPNPGHITVEESQTSSISFGIDRLSTSTVKTREPVEPGTTTDAFADASGISESVSTEIGSGDISLSHDAEAGYATEGSARSVKIAPSFLDSWNELSFTDTTTSDTSVVYHLYYEDASSNVSLVPDSAVSGNSTGLTSSPVDISALDTDTYDNLFIEAELSTNATSTTPTVEDWTLTYFVGPTPVPDITFSLRGDKTIGTTDEGDPIYKYAADHTTGSDGSVTLGGLEWDTYTITIDDQTEGYDVMEACPPSPFSLPPGVASTTELTLVPDSSTSLKVAVKNANDVLLEDAEVRLSRTGYDETKSTSSCGQVFFGDLDTTGNYTLETSHPDYITESQQIDVSGATNVTVSLESETTN